MAWTKDQEKAINITDKNILVSAAPDPVRPLS